MTIRNHWLDRITKDNGRSGRIAEKKAAKRLGGKLRPGSGSIDGAKGDIVLEDFLIESKSTTNDSISVTLSWLAKIYYEALNAGKYPALIVQFVRGNGESGKEHSWVMIPEHVYKKLTEKDDA